MWSDECLRREHAVIDDVLRAVAGLTRLAEGGATELPMLPFHGAIEFFTAYVERFHQAKEEEVVLPFLRSHGRLHADLLRTIETEHEEGRRLLRALRPLGAARAVAPELPRVMAAYVVCKRRHIAFEGAGVVQELGRALSPAADARMHRTFDRIEGAVFGPAGAEVVLALGSAVRQACQAFEGDGSRWQALLVRDLMRPRRGVSHPDESLAHAAAQMESLGTRELPVVDGGRLVGIITRTDLELHRGHWEWTTVRTAMSHDPVTVPPDASPGAVARVLLEHGYNSVPVAVDRCLLGMIGRGDLLRLLDDPDRAS